MKNSDQPLVSILIPCYNSEKLISKVLGCIENQTYKNLEILLHNDFSQDQTYEKLVKYQKSSLYTVRLFNSIKNIGVVSSTNILLENSKGNYIAIIGHDDLMFSNKIEIQVNALEQNKDCTLCTHEYDFYDWINKTVIERKTKSGTKLFTKTNLKKSILSGIVTISCMFKNSDLPKVNNLCPNSDTLFYFDLLGPEKKTITINKKLMYYGRHNNNLTNIKNYESKSMLRDSLIESSILLSKYPNYASIIKKRISNTLRYNRRFFNNDEYVKLLLASISFNKNYKNIGALILFKFLGIKK